MLEVDKYSYHKIKLVEPDAANLTIGKFCSIADNVTVFLGGNHRTDWITTYPFGDIHQDIFGGKVIEGHPSTNGDVIIGNDVWIGRGACIMSGITIGDGAVIAANSHVVNDVRPYEMVGGNPAKHIRFRFSKEVIEYLLRLRWWNKTIKEIRELIPVLMATPDIEKLKQLCE